ncbi:Ca2+-dependent phosphoinositide-specific phospholipase C [Sphingomonas bacterium]|uniref:Ca2+-dependent phosphoinositide-specific phospholipase C n=1 Tax=Sphingomonas bacterium TaxID=1895847 RepID=UPI001C2D75BC|nr:Ca2+-dependent phosphoinositide-specific phospholipase C [Sphingomonas bacterium]
MSGAYLPFRLLLIVAAMFGSVAVAAPHLTVSTATDGSTIYRIDQLEVTQPLTAYPGVVLRQGDVLHVAAGGCVQTGGSGLTWKRFVDPTGANAERIYSGTLEIAGATPLPRGRIANWIGVPIAVTAAAATLQIGYQDDGYGDNGYDHPDPGTDGQCVGQGPAWVTITVAKGAPPPASDPRYNEVAMKSVHNAYQRDESLPDMLGFHHLRSVEIDIHDSNERDQWPELNRDWYVYHNTGVGADDSSTCRKLSDCLRLLRAYHQAVLNHEIITVFIDLKDGFRAQRQQSAEDFEQALLDWLDPDRADYLTPAVLAARCRSGPARRGDCGWPHLSELRGKWAIVLTTNGSLPTYLNCSNPPAVGATCAVRRLAFVAPELCLSGDDPLVSCPDKAIAAHPEARFFNLNAAQPSLLAFGPVLRLKGFIARAYGLSPANGDWPAALANGIELPSTDEVNAAPPTSMITANAQGWPFTCLHEDCNARAADQPTLGVRVASGDISGHSDDFVFAEARRTPAQIETRLFAPGSSVAEWAKACLMARAAMTATAAYFAICRSADKHAPFIQYRLADGADTAQVEIDPNVFKPDLDVSRESITALRLSASSDGRCFTAEASPDGVIWQPVGSRMCLAFALTHRGIAASSHGGTPVSFGYVGLKLDGVSANSTALNVASRIGSVQRAVIADRPL